MGKLPYIPNKDLYAAVMGACSYIRKTGWFNKATEYYADYYDVPLEEVQKYVRIAQGNGQKQASKNKPKRKYMWFAVEYSMGNERNGEAYFEYLDARYTVAKGVSVRTVTDRLSQFDDYKSEYSPCHWFGRVEGFDTEEEAKETARKWKRQWEHDTGRNAKPQKETISPPQEQTKKESKLDFSGIYAIAAKAPSAEQPLFDREKLLHQLHFPESLFGEKK